MSRILALIILLLICNLYATVINIPVDFDSIQEGINSSANGDTVLVQQGIYNENINFSGKEIIVASMFLLTQDTTNIQYTRIFGIDNGCVVTFNSHESNSTKLIGFTISNGMGNIEDAGSFGGGITCINSDPVLANLIINNNFAYSSGGGIYLENSSASISDSKIINNSSEEYGGGIFCIDGSLNLNNVTISSNLSHQGGGLYLRNSSAIISDSHFSSNSVTGEFSRGGGLHSDFSYLSIENSIFEGNSAYGFNSAGGGINLKVSNTIISNVEIFNNHVEYVGGGLSCQYSHNTIITLRETIISNNSAQEFGGGMYLRSANVYFDQDERCSVYSNNVSSLRGFGADMFSLDCEMINVFLHTFTVLNPTDYYASPIENFEFDIIEGFDTNLINCDLYVSPDGYNTNSGLSPYNPLKTINYALSRIYSDDENQVSIFLANGVYSPSSNGECFPIEVSNYVSLIGSSPDSTILDAENQNRVLGLSYVEEASVKNLTIKNGYTDYAGGGLYINDSNVICEDLVIEDNSSNNYLGGGGVFCNSSEVEFRNIVVRNNNSGWHGGGICVIGYGTQTLENILIIDNKSKKFGGGIYCGNYVDCNINNTMITNNYAVKNGGGISFSGANLVLDEVLIEDNFSQENGGGLFIGDSETILKGTNIRYNQALNGGGIYSNSNPDFDAVDRCNIYLNHAEINGNDLFTSVDFTAALDTLTVMNPVDYHTFPRNEFYLTINSSKVEQVDQDLFVNPLGSNNNDGLTIESPLKTISFALTKILPDDDNLLTINLSNGLYKAIYEEEFFPINCRNNVKIIGEDKENTIIDGETNSRIFYGFYDDNFYLENMTIRNGYTSGKGGGILCEYSDFEIENVNLSSNFSSEGGAVYLERSDAELKNLLVSGNSSSGFGGGIACNCSNPIIEKTIITYNTSYFDGGGIFFSRCDYPILENILISNNSSSSEYGYGGGIAIWDFGETNLRNIIIANNFSTNSGGGIFCKRNNLNCRNVLVVDNTTLGTGGGIHLFDSGATFLNSIFWNDIPEEIYIAESNSHQDIFVSHCDIQNGFEGIVNNYETSIDWLEGNIQTYPFFEDEEYHLSPNSPCIDAGNPDPLFYDNEDPENPGFALYPALGSVICDMGAYGGSNSDHWDHVVSGENTIPEPESDLCILHRNSPNPFNPNTTITFSIISESPQFVKLDIYNLKGQIVRNIAYDKFEPGTFTYTWEGINDNNKKVSSGVYFIRLNVANRDLQLRKCLLLK